LTGSLYGTSGCLTQVNGIACFPGLALQLMKAFTSATLSLEASAGRA
jgi:hypothetical protein